VTNESGHVFDPNVMSFGGIVGVFEKQEVHVVFSFAFGAAIFHREPPATHFEDQNVGGYKGVEFFKKGYLFCLNGKIQPLDFESVRNLCTSTNDMGDGWLGIAPTTRSK